MFVCAFHDFYSGAPAYVTRYSEIDYTDLMRDECMWTMVEWQRQGKPKCLKKRLHQSNPVPNKSHKHHHVTETDSQLIFTYTRSEKYTLSSVTVINYERGENLYCTFQSGKYSRSKRRHGSIECRGQLKSDGTRAETRFRLSAKRKSPFKSAGGFSSVDYWQPRCAHQR